jgi:hypothetical protein
MTNLSYTTYVTTNNNNFGDTLHVLEPHFLVPCTYPDNVCVPSYNLRCRHHSVLQLRACQFSLDDHQVLQLVLGFCAVVCASYDAYEASLLVLLLWLYHQVLIQWLPEMLSAPVETVDWSNITIYCTIKEIKGNLHREWSRLAWW